MFIVASSCKHCQKRDSIFNGQTPQCTRHELCMFVSLEQISADCRSWGPLKNYLGLSSWHQKLWDGKVLFERDLKSSPSVFQKERVRNEQWPAFVTIISQDTSNQHMIIILISPKRENNWVKKNPHIIWNDYCLWAIINNDSGLMLGSKTNGSCLKLVQCQKHYQIL